MHKSLWYSCWKFLASKHNVQFILDPYVVANYYTSYLKKRLNSDKSVVTIVIIIISWNEKKLKHIFTFERWEMFF
jgi:hypothetical protein